VFSTNYIIRFVVILTTTVALILSLMSTGLKEVHDRNEAVYSKKAVLSALATKLDVDFKKITDPQVEEIFAKQIQQNVFDASGKDLSVDQVETLGYKGGKAEHVNMGKERKKDDVDQIHPMYTYTDAKGKKSYVVAVRGKGLWDEIWANVALDEDKNTVSGISFDHKAETPGLGAEIKDNVDFGKQFIGKKIFDDKGNYKSIKVMKAGAKDEYFEVDGISGATLTCDGVTEMMVRGMAYYTPVLK